MQLVSEQQLLDSLSRITASHFCELCRSNFVPICSPFCLECGIPFVSKEGDNHTCWECLTEKRYFRKARAFGVYDGSLMEAIHVFKYGKKAVVSTPLVALLRDTFYHFWGRDNVDLLIPVPLHIKRLRERGFNQAHLLITKWARQDQIPFDGLALSRSRWTQPQTVLSRKERKRNIRNAFSVEDSERIRGKKILLVDDVYTTGSTVNECARVLMKAGAEWVDVLTLARAV